MYIMARLLRIFWRFNRLRIKFKLMLCTSERFKFANNSCHIKLSFSMLFTPSLVNKTGKVFLWNSEGKGLTTRDYQVRERTEIVIIPSWTFLWLRNTAVTVMSLLFSAKAPVENPCMWCGYRPRKLIIALLT